jgi:hypothetical protein
MLFCLILLHSTLLDHLLGIYSSTSRFAVGGMFESRGKMARAAFAVVQWQLRRSGRSVCIQDFAAPAAL